VTPIGTSTSQWQGRKGDRPSGGSRRQTCGSTNRNRIQGRYTQASGPGITKPCYPGVQVNAEAVQGKFTFLSGEICLTYLGVGLARKPGPCMRKLLGVGQKSAEVVVLDLTRH